MNSESLPGPFTEMFVTNPGSDMFAKAIQGDSPESAVAWAEKEMQTAYAS